MCDSKKAEVPNWVEIGTLVTVVLIALAGFIKFVQFDRVLSNVDIKLKQQDVDFKKEETLQIRGTLRRINSGSVNLASVVINIDNIRKMPVQINKCELIITPISIPKDINEVILKDINFNRSEGSTSEELKESLSKITILSFETPGKLTPLHVKSQPVTHRYDPKAHSGGKILAGQQREVTFDLLVQESSLPSLYKLEVSCWFDGEKSPLMWETWMGIGGFPERPGKDARSSYAAPH